MKHYGLFFLLFLGLQTLAAAQASDPLVADFLTQWDNAMEYTIETAELMPQEHYDFRPTPDQRTFAGQLAHICGNMLWLSTEYLGGPEFTAIDIDHPPSDKEGLLELLRLSYRHARSAVESLSSAELDKEVQFFAGPMSKRKILLLLSDHATHHRGQLVVYLRLKGVEPPRYRGW